MPRTCHIQPGQHIFCAVNHLEIEFTGHEPGTKHYTDSSLTPCVAIQGKCMSLLPLVNATGLVSLEHGVNTLRCNAFMTLDTQMSMCHYCNHELLLMDQGCKNAKAQCNMERAGRGDNCDFDIHTHAHTVC